MAMDVDRLTVKIDTDIRGLTSGLRAATSQTQAFGTQVQGATGQTKAFETQVKRAGTSSSKSAKQSEAAFTQVTRSITAAKQAASGGVDFEARTNTSAIDKIKGLFTGVRSDASRGATFKVDAEQSGIDRLEGIFTKLRSDAATGATFKVNADESGIAAVNQAINATRQNVQNGANFKVIADASGIEGMATKIQVLRSDAANGASFTVRADMDDSAATAKLSAFEAKKAAASTDIHSNVDLDATGATAELGAFQGLVSWFDGKEINMPVDINTVSSIVGLFSVQAAVISLGAQLLGLSASSAIASGSLTGLGAAAATAGAGIATLAAGVVAVVTAVEIVHTLTSAVLGAVAAFAGLGAGAVVGLGLVVGSIYTLTQATGPLGEAFAELSDHASNLYYDFQAAFEPAAALLPPIGNAALDVAQNYIPLLGEAATATIGAMTPVFNSFLDWLDQGGVGFNIMATIIAGATPIMEALSDTVVSLLQGFLAMAATATPAAIELADSIAAIAQRFAEWATSAEGQEQILGWIDTAKIVFPAIRDAIVDIIDAFANMEGFDAETLASGIRSVGESIASIIGYIDQIKGAWDGLMETLTAIDTWLNTLVGAEGSSWQEFSAALLGGLQGAWDSATTWLAGLVPDITLMDVLTGHGTLVGAAESGGLAAQLILALESAWTTANEWLAGLAPEVSLWDVLVGDATLQEGAEGGSPAASVIVALGEAWTAVNEWMAGLVPDITLMDVIMGNATMGEAAEEGGIAATIITSLTEAWTAVTEWMAGLVPDITLMDVIMGNATMGEAAEEGGIAATIIASLTEAWTGVTEWIAGLAPEITLMDVIMGNATMEEAADSGSIAAQAIELLQSAWDSVMGWLGGLVPDISLTDIVLGVESVAATVGEFIAAIGAAFASGWATITQTFTDFFTSLYNDYWLYYFGADGVLVTGVLDFFSTLYNDYWLYYFGADGVLVTGILDFFTSLYNDYWLYYFGADGVLITGILDFFTSLYNDYWLYYFGLDGVLVTGIIDFFTSLYNDYWLYYFGLDGVLITGVIDFFTSLYNDYWLYYFGLDGVLVTGIIDFFTSLYNDYWLYYFGLDGVLIGGIIDFFTSLYNDYWLYYFGLDGALIGPIIDFFTSLYNDYFLYYLGPDGVVVTAVADAWDAILTAIPEFVRSFGNLLGNGLASGINAGIGFLQGLLNAIDEVLTAINVSPLRITLSTVEFQEFASGGSTESMAAGGSRGGAGSRARQPKHIVWDEGMGEEYWIATGPAADKRKNVGWLAKAAGALGLGIVPMQEGGVIGSGGRLSGISRTRMRPPVTYSAREFPDETTAATTASTVSTVGSASALGATGALGEKKLTRRQKRRARRRERRGVGTTTSTGLTGTAPTTSGTTPTTSGATTPTAGMPTTTPVTPTATGTMPTSGFPARGTGMGGMRRNRSRTDGRARNHRRRGRDRARGRGHRRNRRAMGGDTSGLVPTLYMQDGGFVHVGPGGLSGRAYDIASEISSQFGVYPNTYIDGPLGPHGSLHGNTPENTFDFWGPGGPGDPIDPGTAEAILSYLYANYGSELDTVIWNGQGEGPGGIFPDENHFDHLHASIGGGGLMNTAGVVASALFSKMKGIWDSAMSALGDPLVGDGALWDGIETYLATLPALAWAWLKTKVPRGTGTSVLRGLGPSGSVLQLAEEGIEAKGWAASELEALNKLWGEGESGWDPNAVNPQSGAYGIPQINPNSWGTPVPLGDAAAQIEWGLNYIAETYGTPSAALDWWLANNSYATGGTTGALVSDPISQFISATGSGEFIDVQNTGLTQGRGARIRVRPRSTYKNRSQSGASPAQSTSTFGGAMPGAGRAGRAGGRGGRRGGRRGGGRGGGRSHRGRRGRAGNISQTGSTGNISQTGSNSFQRVNTNFYGNMKNVQSHMAEGGFIDVPAYDTGGMVPGFGPQLGLVHGGERVLPRNINQGFESLARSVDRWDGAAVSGMGGAGANNDPDAVLEEILVELKRGNDNPTPVDINNMSDMQRSFVAGFMSGIDSDQATDVLDKKMAEGVRYATQLGGL